MKNLRSSFLLSTLAFLLCAVITAQAADISITAANVLPSANADRQLGTAGVAITAGQACYLDPTTNTWKLADANGASPLYKIGGIAINNAAAGQPVAICTGDDSFTLGGTVAAGAIVILSGTAGALAPAADAVSGWYVQIVGVGIGSNKIKFRMLRSDAAVP